MMRNPTNRGRMDKASDEKRGTLLNREGLYQTIVENIDGVIMLTSPDGTIEYLSPACERVLGHDPEDLVGSMPWIMHPDDIAMAKKAMGHAQERGGGSNLEYRVLTKSGKTRWVSHSWSPMISDGKFEMIVSVVRDITEQKVAEEALQESEVRYRSLFGRLPMGMFRATPKGNILDANPALVDMLGFEDLDAMVSIDAGKAKIIHQVAHWFRTHSKKRVVVRDLEAKVFRQDGAAVWVRANARAIRGDSGEILQIEGTLEDITESRRTAAKLRESENRYHGLFDHVPVGLYRTTPQGEIQDVNPTLVEMLGYDNREAMRSLDAVDFYVDAEDRTHWESLMDRDGEVRNFEVEYQRSDGTKIWMRESARTLRDANGRIICYEGTLEDISERKQKSEEIKRLKEFNEEIVQNVGEGIVVVDVSGQYALVNPAAARMLGYLPKELLGKPWTAIVPADHQPIVEAADKRRIRGESDRYRLVLQRKDGSRMPVLVSASPRFEEGKFAGSLSVFSDLSDIEG